MSDIGAFIDVMKTAFRAVRSREQMTLGKLIERLESMPRDLEIIGLGELDSYRGYYEDLAFSSDDTPKAVSLLLDECRAAVGETYCGYKGGDFVMDLDTPLWVAEHGCCGEKIISIEDDGSIVTEEDEGW